MTQDSYTNYVANMMVSQSVLADDVVTALQNGNCDWCTLQMKFLLGVCYIDVLKCWELFDDTTSSTTVEESGVQNKDAFLNQVIEMSSAAINTLNLVVGDTVDVTNAVSGQVVSDSTVIDIDLQAASNTYYVYLDTFTTYNGATVTVSKDMSTEDSNPNCLTVDEMKDIALNLNKIYKTKYCVDFTL